MTAKIPRIRVSPEQLREIFNRERFRERVQNGELSEKVDSENPCPTASGEPPGTLSQMVAYLDSNGHRVAVVHQYLRKNGELGGWGRPDPKKLIYQGTIYVV